MKTSIFALLFLFFASCQKNVQTVQRTSGQGSMSYNLQDGSTVSFAGSYSTALAGEPGVYIKHEVTPKKIFRVTGQHGQNNLLQLIIETEVLTPSTFVIPKAESDLHSTIVRNGVIYTTYSNKTNSKVNVTFTSIEGGKASGTFSGKFYSLVNGSFNDSLIVSNGQFSDVPIVE